MTPALPARYQVRARLGQGGMATVYLAADTATEGDVAIKVLHPELRADPLVAARFRREIATARRVSHPNVVAIHDLVETPQCLALVLEHIPGGDLKRRLRLEGKQSSDRVRQIAHDVLSGLAAAHAQGIVHRDLKPENLLVGADGRVKIADFGLARLDDVHGMTLHTRVLGTPEYMAPEMLDSPLVDGRADLFGLGVSLYELATGKLPFQADSPHALVALHARGHVPDPLALEPTLDRAIAEAIRRALEPDPERRFQTAGEMRAALDGRMAIAEADGRACARCGTTLVAGLAACTECGHAPLRIAARSGARHRVWLLRFAGRDALTGATHEEASRIIDELVALGGVVAADPRSLRALPVVIADHLEEADARLLAARLCERGIPARAERVGLHELSLAVVPPVDPAAPLGNRLRSQLGVAGSYAMGAVTAFGIAVQGATPTAFAIAGTIAVAIGVTLRLDWRRRARPLARFEAPAEPLAGPPLLEQAARLFPALRSPRLRAMVRRALQRALDVRRRVQQSIDQSTLMELDRLLGEVLADAERIAAIERALDEVDLGRLREELELADRRVSRAPTVAAAAPHVERAAGLRSRLAAVDESGREIVALTGRLLAATAALNAAREALAEPSSDPRSSADSVARTLMAALEAARSLG